MRGRGRRKRQRRRRRINNHDSKFSPSHPLAIPKGRRKMEEVEEEENEEKGSKKMKLCTNACQVADLWMNCGELAEQWSEWLCSSGSSRGSRDREARERLRNCRATCTCQGQIRN